MKLEDAGIAPDTREGRTLRTSATTPLGEDTSKATNATMMSMLRTADDLDLTVDVATMRTATKPMRSKDGVLLATLVVTSAVAYPHG